MHQSPPNIFTTNDITLPITNHNADQSITTFVWIYNSHLTLKMTSAQTVELSVTTKSASQDSFYLDDQIPSKYVTPGFKPSSNKGHTNLLWQNRNEILSYLLPYLKGTFTENTRQKRLVGNMVGKLFALFCFLEDMVYFVAVI